MISLSLYGRSPGQRVIVAPASIRDVVTLEDGRCLVRLRSGQVFEIKHRAEDVRALLEPAGVARVG